MPPKKRIEEKLPPPDSLNQDDEVEQIIDSKFIKGKSFYLLRWKGYDSSNDTWEPAENLQCPEILAKYISGRKRRRSSSVRSTSEEPKTIPKIRGRPKRNSPVGATENENASFRRVAEVENSFSSVDEILGNTEEPVASDVLKPSDDKGVDGDDQFYSCPMEQGDYCQSYDAKLTPILSTDGENQSPDIVEVLQNKTLDKLAKAKIGFERGYKPEQILGAVNRPDGMYFIMKWENFHIIDLVASKELTEKYPKMLIDFYRKHLIWSLEDSS